MVRSSGIAWTLPEHDGDTREIMWHMRVGWLKCQL